MFTEASEQYAFDILLADRNNACVLWLIINDLLILRNITNVVSITHREHGCE